MRSKMIELNLVDYFKTQFTTSEQLRFIEHFKLYVEDEKNTERFKIDLDDVYDWMGYSRKDPAKRHLTKGIYTEGVDYIITNATISKQHGGCNKETIKMTTECFKSMCMLAKNERGAQTRLYYIKMETMHFEYLKTQKDDEIQRYKEYADKLIAQNKRECEEKAAKEKEKVLQDKHRNTAVVYLLKVDENFIKIGETNDIVTRIRSLHTDYPESVLVDVFPCVRNHEFEQYILNRPDVRKHRVPGTEVVKLTNEFTYDSLNTIIKKNLPSFNSAAGVIEQMKLKSYVLLLELLQKAETEDEKQLYRKQLTDKGYVVHDVDNTKDSNPESHRKVFKYDPTNLKDYVEVFANLREAARSLNNIGFRDYHIRDAAQNNTLFAGFRWYYVDNDEDAPSCIPETVTPSIEPKAQTAFHVAQLSLDKTIVLNVYGAVCKAAEAVSSPACSICTAITRGTALKKFYWAKYDDLPDELKQTYTDPLPPLFKPTTCSKFVERIDPITDRVVEVLDTMQEVNARYKISHKKLNDLTSSGDIYKGFKWRVVSKKGEDIHVERPIETQEEPIVQEVQQEVEPSQQPTENKPTTKTRKPSSAAQKVFKCTNSKEVLVVYQTIKEAREANEFKYSETEIRKAAKDCTLLDGFRWVISFDEIPEIPDTHISSKTHSKTYDYFVVIDNSTKEIVKVFPNQRDVAEHLGISPALANKRFQDKIPVKDKQIWAWDKLPTESKEAYLHKGNILPIKKSAQSKSIIRIDPDTQEEHTYVSIVDATDTLHVARRDIMNAIKTNTAFHGYNWKWAM